MASEHREIAHAATDHPNVAQAHANPVEVGNTMPVHEIVSLPSTHPVSSTIDSNHERPSLVNGCANTEEQVGEVPILLIDNTPSVLSVTAGAAGTASGTSYGALGAHLQRRTVRQNTALLPGQFYWGGGRPLDGEGGLVRFGSGDGGLRLVDALNGDLAMLSNKDDEAFQHPVSTKVACYINANVSLFERYVLLT